MDEIIVFSEATRTSTLSARRDRTIPASPRIPLHQRPTAGSEPGRGRLRRRRAARDRLRPELRTAWQPHPRLDTDNAGGTSGQILPGWPVVLPGNSEGSPVVGDIDGDGSPDILHGIGGGDESAPNNLYAFHADGTPVDGFPITLDRSARCRRR